MSSTTHPRPASPPSHPSDDMSDPSVDERSAPGASDTRASGTRASGTRVSDGAHEPGGPAGSRGGRLSSWARGLVRGPEGAPRWERPALLALLVGTAVLYLWNLGVNGYANSFYSAAVQAGSTNWEAFFFGSSDAANSITVDKPPASLWLMALSVRLFGLSPVSILLPEALMGVATVGVIYAAVRRHFSAGTALLAGTVLALTPVAALMFRFNNPDALLVLLLSLATLFTLRAVEHARLRWLLLAGVMVGLGFLTKQLQAFLILPVLAGVYLVAAPTALRRRFGHLVAALGAVIVSAGWWVAIVELVPADLRPYIGGSQNNSFLELTFGYNGLGRLTGDEVGSVTGGGGGGAAAGGMWGETGLLRLFSGEIGGQITWLLPAALALLVTAVVVMWRRPRVDAARATLLLFGGWLLITAVAFSFMAGIFHAYYTVALAPALAAVVAIGANVLWRLRRRAWARVVAAATMLVTTVWSVVLLSQAGEWMPWLRLVVAVTGVAASVLLVLPARGRMLRLSALALALVAALLGPAAYTVQTVATAHTGSIVTAGPTVSAGGGGMGGGPGGGQAGQGGQGGPGGAGTGTGTGNGTGAGTAPGNGMGTPPQGFGGTGTPPQGTTGGPNAGTGTGTAPGGGAGTGTGTQGGPGTGTGAAGGRGGGMSGLLGGGTASADVVALLTADADAYTWVAATTGSQSAATYQLAAEASVMPIGGFNGSDPSPTLSQFQEYVAAGKIHYYIAGSSGGGANGGSSASSEIAAWVEATFTAQTVDGVTLYDLS